MKNIYKQKRFDFPMVFSRKKRAQAAIEFLMTYGWMLLVVLIVGALIFSFVDFGSLLPNKLDLSNNIRGDPTASVAYSKDTSALNVANDVIISFRFNGAKRVAIADVDGLITTDLGQNCESYNVTNLDTGETIEASGSVGSFTTSGSVAFLNGDDGIMKFACQQAMFEGDALDGNVKLLVADPKSNVKIPSTGPIRLQVITG